MEPKEYTLRPIYSSETGLEIGRIRVKRLIIKGCLKSATCQLEGNILGKWLPLIRYDFSPWERIPIHIQNEYISPDHKEELCCDPEDLIEIAKKKFTSFSENYVLYLIKRGKWCF